MDKSKPIPENLKELILTGKTYVGFNVYEEVLIWKLAVALDKAVDLLQAVSHPETAQETLTQIQAFLHPYTMEDVWALWPDDMICPREEVAVALSTGKSDDFEWVNVLRYDATGQPVHVRNFNGEERWLAAA